MPFYKSLLQVLFRGSLNSSLLMFLTLSSDQIQWFWPQGSETLPFFQIEKNFWPWMAKIIQTQKPEKIYVLNWPWSFTTLRVCCLALTIMKQHYWFTMYTTTKPALFQSLQHFPEFLGLTIGQKQNCWLWNTTTQHYEKVPFSDRYKKWVLIDPLLHLPESLPNDAYARILHRKRDDEKATVALENNGQQWYLDFSASCRKKIEKLDPMYLIDPTM